MKIARDYLDAECYWPQHNQEIGREITGSAFANTVKSIATIKLMLKSPAKASHVRSGIDGDIIVGIYLSRLYDLTFLAIRDRRDSN